MKYIIVEISVYSENTDNTIKMKMPFIFSQLLIHSEFFKTVKPLLQSQYTSDNQVVTSISVVSAGEYNSVSNQCYGESRTLNKRAKEEDTSFIKSYTYTMGLCE